MAHIGMGQTELRGNIMQGDGVYKTTDGGKTWKNAGLVETQAIARTSVHPTNPDIATKPPTRAAGINRFTWDLRYQGTNTFEGLIMLGARPEQGPLAPSGEYHMRIIVNGAMQTEDLRLSKDPRLAAVSNADMEEQFKLAVPVRDKVSEADQIVIQIREIKKQFKDSAEKARNPDLNAAAERLESKLKAVEEDVYQVRNRSNQDPLNFPIKLNNQLAALARSIETGDAKPTDASYVVFKELTARLDALKARLDEALKTNLVQVNDLLTGRQMEKIAK